VFPSALTSLSYVSNKFSSFIDNMTIIVYVFTWGTSLSYYSGVGGRKSGWLLLK
jgi:hypothetical protein